MTKHSLRPIAICVMFATGLSLVAPQNLSAQAAASQSSLGTIQGKALDSKGKTVPNSTVQLRDVTTGQVVATATPTAAGAYTFAAVAGTYVVEVVGATGAVLATSGAVAVAAGATVTAAVTVSAAVGAAAAAGAAGAAGVLGMSIPVAAAVIGSAAAAGILAVNSEDCVSPPCQ